MSFTNGLKKGLARGASMVKKSLNFVISPFMFYPSLITAVRRTNRLAPIYGTPSIPVHQALLTALIYTPFMPLAAAITIPIGLVGAVLSIALIPFLALGEGFLGLLKKQPAATEVTSSTAPKDHTQLTKEVSSIKPEVQAQMKNTGVFVMPTVVRPITPTYSFRVIGANVYLTPTLPPPKINVSMTPITPALLAQITKGVGGITPEVQAQITEAALSMTPETRDQMTKGTWVMTQEVQAQIEDAKKALFDKLAEEVSSMAPEAQAQIEAMAKTPAVVTPMTPERLAQLTETLSLMTPEGRVGTPQASRQHAPR